MNSKPPNYTLPKKIGSLIPNSFAKPPDQQPAAQMDEEAEQRAHREYMRNYRIERFKTVCPPQFLEKIDDSKLKNAEAFNAARAWNGTYPGPLLIGPTGLAKTRAAWSACANLYINYAQTFELFTADRIIQKLDSARGDIAAELSYIHKWSGVFFFDDLHRFNTHFESQGRVVAQVYDWIYSQKVPTIMTTNKNREWWHNLLGESTARRMFDEAHNVINF